MRKNRWFDSASTFALSKIVQCSIDGESPDTGSLTIDQAVGLIDARDAPVVEPVEHEQNPEAGNSPADDAAGAGDEQPTDGEIDPNAEAAGAEPEPIEAPRSWNAEAKAKFADLPREVQEIIASREGEREGALTRAQQEAAETRKKAETEFSQIGQYKAALDKLLPQAEEMFAHRWAKVDWAKLTGEIGADEALKLKFQFENEQGELQRLRDAQQTASNVTFQRYVVSEGEKLKTLAPDLADVKEGPARRTAVGKFLVDSGIEPEQLRGISAAALAIAYDAMRFREAKAALAKPKPATPAKPAVRPTAGRPAVAPQKQTVATLHARFMKSGKQDDYVAYLDAKDA